MMEEIIEEIEEEDSAVIPEEMYLLIQRIVDKAKKEVFDDLDKYITYDCISINLEELEELKKKHLSTQASPKKAQSYNKC